MSTNASIESIAINNRQASSTVWLWWKETRQLIPLAAMLAIVSLLVAMLNSLVSGLIGNRGYVLSTEMLMLVFPGLFATGAGPLLVGQERMSRTLDWLVLLPISAKRLVLTKFLVALAGLCVMWVFAIFMLAFVSTGGWRFGSTTLYSGTMFSYPFWGVHSLFLLAAGFFVSWWITNQFYSLIALVGLAFSPWLATQCLAGILDANFLGDQFEFWMLVFTCVGTLALVPMTYLSAVRALSPAAAPTATPILDQPRRRHGDSILAIAPRFGTQLGALIWQSLFASLGVWCILCAMMMLSGFALLATEQNSKLGEAFASVLGPFGGALPLLGLALVATSWLGVAVFKHDGSIDRIRFLADRGVSPATAYLTRHAFPLAVLSASLFLYGIWLFFRQTSPGPVTQMPSVLSLTLFALLLYGISQWISQLVRTWILAVILAPIVSIMVVAWLLFAYTMIGFPLWGLAAVMLVPFAATAGMMRRYMDARDQPAAFWMAGFVLLWIIGIPIGHAAQRIVRTPRMNSAKRSELLAEGQRADDLSNAVQLTFTWTNREHFNRDGTMLSPKELLLRQGAYREHPSQWLEQLDKLRADPTLAATSDRYYLTQWQARITRAKLNWLHAEESSREIAFERFATWMEATSVLLPALRRSVQLVDQNNADELEAMLVELLQSDVLADKLDYPDVRAAIASLGDPETRADARRRAVLATWYRIATNSNLRTFRFKILETVPAGLSPWLGPRYDEMFVLAALEGIESSRQPRNEEGWRRKLHALQQPHGVFETSRYGDAMRQLPASMTRMRYGLPGYGDLWGCPWEYVNLEVSE